jgi:ribosomal protein S18 acetylase RimI-like enzyme
MPQTGEYVLAEAWRNREDIAQIVEATSRKGQARLVSAAIDRAQELGYTQVVLGDEVMNANRRLYSGLGFTHLERVIILRRSLKRDDDLPDLSAVPPIEMRRAGYSDVGTLVRVDNDSFPWLWWNSRREFEAYVDMSGVQIYLAYLDGEPVGYTSLTMYDNWAHLDRIGVVSASQGKGFGAAQLAYILRLMVDLGAGHVALSTQLSNTQSHKLYERFGFTRTGDNMDFYGLKL